MREETAEGAMGCEFQDNLAALMTLANEEAVSTNVHVD